MSGNDCTTGSTTRSSNTSRGKGFFSSPKRQQRPWGPPSLPLNGCRSYFPQAKKPGHQVNHWHPSSTKTECSYTFFFLSFFLSYSDIFYVLNIGAEDYCCTSTHLETHTETVGLLWISDQPEAEASTWQHATPTRDKRAPGRTRIRNLSGSRPRRSARRSASGTTYAVCRGGLTGWWQLNNRRSEKKKTPFVRSNNRPERRAGAYRSSRKKKHPIFLCPLYASTVWTGKTFPFTSMIIILLSVMWQNLKHSDKWIATTKGQSKKNQMATNGLPLLFFMFTKF